MKLTEFQLNLEKRLNALLRQHETRSFARSVSDTLPEHVKLNVLGTELEIWIYDDEVEFQLGDEGAIWEVPDYQSSEEIADSFLSHIDKLLSDLGVAQKHLVPADN